MLRSQDRTVLFDMHLDRNYNLTVFRAAIFVAVHSCGAEVTTIYRRDVMLEDRVALAFEFFCSFVHSTSRANAIF